ncbi:hypothetical protein THAOC_25238 [Thalassiosira oceanica]|uniref:Uncharacterized protein n=1 Tax=Thalassiosira oceanica TaxID=159749 RepID=K0S8F4_THAOC|nr:hypothetical protein THAOC_25238 [Thalassiosira oceanica]|eukprot:EJK55067.1 hypothetical protein THAOC_25238 [Thalassiosira oceanica]
MDEAPKIDQDSRGVSVKDKETAAIRACVSSLVEIKTALLPFLRVLNEDNKESGVAKKPNDGDDGDRGRNTPSKPSLSSHKRAEAQAAVALAVGTLKHMGRRLQGLKQDGSLREELDKTRKLIVLLRKGEAGDERGRGGRDNIGIGAETSKRKESVRQNGRSTKRPRRFMFSGKDPFARIETSPMHRNLHTLPIPMGSGKTTWEQGIVWGRRARAESSEEAGGLNSLGAARGTKAKRT